LSSALCAEPKPRRGGFILAQGKRSAALGDGEEWHCGLKGHFKSDRRRGFEVPLQGTWMRGTVPGAALRLPRAMVYPARWAGGRSETSRPTLSHTDPFARFAVTLLHRKKLCASALKKRAMQIKDRSLLRVRCDLKAHQGPESAYQAGHYPTGRSPRIRSHRHRVSGNRL
jgi:hypothetical protein